MKAAIQSLHIESSPLSQLRYHWFRGLYLGAGDSGLLVDAEVLKLSADPSLLQARLEKQVEIDGYSGLWRLIYWVFNLSNYAYSGYVLACYQARFHETTPRFNGEVSLWANLSYTLKWAREKLRSLLQGNDSSALVKISDAGVEGDRAGRSEVPLSFKVTVEMIEHFTLLGKEVKEGDEMSMELFKVLYHRELLKTHPDKKGGSAEAFDKVRHAAKTILGLVQGTLSPEDALSRACDDLERKLNELDIRIEELERGFEEIRRDHEEIRRDHEEIRRDHEEIRRKQVSQSRWLEEKWREQAKMSAQLEKVRHFLEDICRKLDLVELAVSDRGPSVSTGSVELGGIGGQGTAVGHSNNTSSFFSLPSSPPNIAVDIGSDAGPASSAAAGSSQSVRGTGM